MRVTQIKTFLLSLFILSPLFLFQPKALGVEAVRDPLQVNPFSDSVKIEKTGTVTLRFHMNLPKDYYAYADVFKFNVVDTDHLEITKTHISPLVEFFDKFSNQNRSGFKDKGELTIQLLAKNLNLKNKKQLEIQMTYQACSIEFCLLPTKKTILQKIEISDQALSSSLSLGDTLAQLSIEDLLNNGLFLTFLFIFFAGILTSFTPCIFPMIPITLSILGTQTLGQTRVKGFFISLSYVLGIATTYSTLGVLAAKTGTLFGSYLSSPWAISFIAITFILMALSMFGLFEVQIPLSIRTRLGNKKISQNYVGAFISGLIAGIVASPCVGPVLIVLLTFVAQNQNPLLGFSLLFTYALGLGLLFIILGTFTQFLSKLPKSGPWLNYTKKIFGIILILMAFYYMAPIAKPFFQKSKASSAKTQDSLWKPYREELLSKAATQSQIVIIDFSAEWCVACLELDKYTFSQQEVHEIIKDMMLLKVDATLENDEVSPIIEKYKVIGLPTVIFLERDGTLRSDLTLTGFESSTDFIKRLKKLKSL